MNRPNTKRDIWPLSVIIFKTSLISALNKYQGQWHMQNIKGHVYDTQYAIGFHYSIKLHGNVSLNINCVETLLSTTISCAMWWCYNCTYSWLWQLMTPSGQLYPTYPLIRMLSQFRSRLGHTVKMEKFVPLQEIWQLTHWRITKDVSV